VGALVSGLQSIGGCGCTGRTPLCAR
jgi:hypothetical protein